MTGKAKISAIIGGLSHYPIDLLTNSSISVDCLVFYQGSRWIPRICCLSGFIFPWWKVAFTRWILETHKEPFSK